MSENKSEDNKHNNCSILEKFLLPIIGIAGLMILQNIYPTYVTNVVGIIYPSYCTIITIETEKSDSYKKWMTYWIVFAIFTLLDYIGKKFIIYNFFKLIVLVWCFYPKSKGSGIIYSFLIEKYVPTKVNITEHKESIYSYDQYKASSNKLSEYSKDLTENKEN
jgi:hypothetical protein